MFLCRTFHTVPEQGQGMTPIVLSSGSGPGLCFGTRHSQCDYPMNCLCTHTHTHVPDWIVGESDS